MKQTSAIQKSFAFDEKLAFQSINGSLTMDIDDLSSDTTLSKNLAQSKSHKCRATAD
jgi:hypothetical protein